MQLKFYESENFCTFSFHRMTNEKFNKAMHKFVGVLDRYGGDKVACVAGVERGRG